jgi:hypothetical protein
MKLEAEIAKPQRDMTSERVEAVTMRLIEQFNARVYPFPEEFSEEQIDCIAGWAGMDDKATFTPGDEPLIAVYDLNPTLGENTYPKFAEILRKRKAEWDEKHRAESNLRRGEHLLESAVDACVIAGMSKEAITMQVNDYCHHNGL